MITDNTNKNKYFPHKDLSYKLIGLFYDVRNDYGIAHKELVYQNILGEKLDEAQIKYRREVDIPITSLKTGKRLGNYRIDFVIEDKIVVETKAMKFIPDKIAQQLFTYLIHTPYEVGYLVNFSSPKFYFKRFILSKK